MADAFRQNKLIPHLLSVLSYLVLLLAYASNACASPLAFRTPSPDADTAYHWKRVAPVVVTSGTGADSTVINPSTDAIIAQGSATDGGGTDFSLTAIIWLAFVLAVGAPLGLAGIRLYRVTTGLAIGLSIAFTVWAAFVNTVNAAGLSDILLTVIVLIAFALGFVVGLFNIGRMVGILLIGVLGGFSIGVRVVLLRPGLLVPTYIINWLVLVPFMIVGVGVVLVRQRLGLVSGCAAIGTFLVGLGVDLIIEKQSGISFGLRFLFDRNNSHFLAIVHQGYKPSLMTQIILGASIGAIPILAFAQHKIFKAPFRPKSSDMNSDSTSIFETEPPEHGLTKPEGPGLQPPPTRQSAAQFLKSRFSLS